MLITHLQSKSYMWHLVLQMAQAGPESPGLSHCPSVIDCEPTMCDIPDKDKPSWLIVAETNIYFSQLLSDSPFSVALVAKFASQNPYGHC